METCSRALRPSDWGKGPPSNRKTTLSTRPRQHRSGFMDKSQCPWVAQPEPGLESDLTSLERPENSYGATHPSNAYRAWEDLQRRMGETPQTQVCPAYPRGLKAVIAAKCASTKDWVKGLNTYVNVTFQFLFWIHLQIYIFFKNNGFCFVIMGYCM